MSTNQGLSFDYMTRSVGGVENQNGVEPDRSCPELYDIFHFSTIIKRQLKYILISLLGLKQDSKSLNWVYYSHSASAAG